METTAHSLYPPSWLDRFTEWVERLPGRSWLFYPTLGLVLALVPTVAHWADGSYPIGTFNAFHIWLAVQAPFFLALIRYLDVAAEAALRDFRPALEVSEEEYIELRYRLTTASARPALLSSLAGVAVAFLLIPLFPMMYTLVGWSTGPASVIAVGLTFLLLGVGGTVVYHTIYQLRLVNQIYATKAIVNLFDLSPLYAFSGLTSQTAVGLIIYNTMWFATAPQLLSQPVSIGFGVFWAVLSIVTFIWPLLGIHGRLAQEKQRLLRESSQRLEATIAELHGRVDSGKSHTLDELHVTRATLEILEIERSMLTGIPTWPWRPETLRGFVSALLLPLALFVIQFVLQRFFAQ
ncbi:hypothetical protein E4H04_08895 [Candidatus Bathyarchaeota archaeon]|nr:MAG: hypothetical protein E4H04_08895 [Candidatus Bathyarchaeota archaeon]